MGNSDFYCLICVTVVYLVFIAFQISQSVRIYEFLSVRKDFKLTKINSFLELKENRALD